MYHDSVTQPPYTLPTSMPPFPDLFEEDDPPAPREQPRQHPIQQPRQHPPKIVHRISFALLDEPESSIQDAIHPDSHPPPVSAKAIHPDSTPIDLPQDHPPIGQQANTVSPLIHPSPAPAIPRPVSFSEELVYRELPPLPSLSFQSIFLSDAYSHESDSLPRKKLRSAHAPHHPIHRAQHHPSNNDALPPRQTSRDTSHHSHQPFHHSSNKKQLYPWHPFQYPSEHPSQYPLQDHSPHPHPSHPHPTHPHPTHPHPPHPHPPHHPPHHPPNHHSSHTEEYVLKQSTTKFLTAMYSPKPKPRPRPDHQHEIDAAQIVGMLLSLPSKEQIASSMRAWAEVSDLSTPSGQCLMFFTLLYILRDVHVLPFRFRRTEDQTLLIEMNQPPTTNPSLFYSVSHPGNNTGQKSPQTGQHSLRAKQDESNAAKNSLSSTTQLPQFSQCEAASVQSFQLVHIRDWLEWVITHHPGFEPYFLEQFHYAVLLMTRQTHSLANTLLKLECFDIAEVIATLEDPLYPQLNLTNILPLPKFLRILVSRDYSLLPETNWLLELALRLWYHPTQSLSSHLTCLLQRYPHPEAFIPELALLVRHAQLDRIAWEVPVDMDLLQVGCLLLSHAPPWTRPTALHPRNWLDEPISSKRNILHPSSGRHDHIPQVSQSKHFEESAESDEDANDTFTNNPKHSCTNPPSNSLNDNHSNSLTNNPSNSLTNNAKGVLTKDPSNPPLLSQTNPAIDPVSPMAPQGLTKKSLMMRAIDAKCSMDQFRSLIVGLFKSPTVIQQLFLRFQEATDNKADLRQMEYEQRVSKLEKKSLSNFVRSAYEFNSNPVNVHAFYQETEIFLSDNLNTISSHLPLYIELVMSVLSSAVFCCPCEEKANRTLLKLLDGFKSAFPNHRLCRDLLTRIDGLISFVLVKLGDVELGTYPHFIHLHNLLGLTHEDPPAPVNPYSDSPTPSNPDNPISEYRSTRPLSPTPSPSLNNAPLESPAHFSSPSSPYSPLPQISPSSTKNEGQLSLQFLNHIKTILQSSASQPQSFTGLREHFLHEAGDNMHRIQFISDLAKYYNSRKLLIKSLTTGQACQGMLSQERTLPIPYLTEPPSFSREFLRRHWSGGLRRQMNGPLYVLDLLDWHVDSVQAMLLTLL